MTQAAVPPDIQAERQAEHDRARSMPELNALYRKWREEDDAAAQAKQTARKPEATRNARLEQRVCDLEAIVVGSDKKLGGLLTQAVGRKLGEAKQELRREIDSLHPVIKAQQARIQEFEERQSRSLHDAGIWRDDHGYDPGALVSHDGAAWVAQRACSAGERPGTSSGFRLAAKSNMAELRRAIREELGRKESVLK
jgi:hypothetical protein